MQWIGSAHIHIHNAHNVNPHFDSFKKIKLIKTAAHSQNRALITNHLNASVILFAFDGRKNTTNCSIYLQVSLSYFTFFLNQRN